MQQIHIVGQCIFLIHAHGRHLHGGVVLLHLPAAQTLAQCNGINFVRVGGAEFLDHGIGEQILTGGILHTEHAHRTAGGFVVLGFSLQAHGNVVDAEALQTVGNGAGEGIAQRNNGDHRADADDDAQHGEQRPQLVGPQAAEGQADVIKQLHCVPPPFAPPQTGRPAA